MDLLSGFRRCGLLTIGEPPYDDLSRVITNVRGVGQECLQLTGDEINKRFPGLSLSSLECGAFEPRSGLIQADLALKALQVSWPQLFKRVDSTIRWINHYPVDLRPFNSIQFNSILYSHYTRYLHKCT